jgi:NTP pyrophosphatase (non-canonical NTP hydrolase)
MNEKIAEALGILQEECAEVIVEVSKCRRFGIDSKHYNTEQLHKDMLTEEVGDVMAMIDILVDQEVLNRVDIIRASLRKKEKLKQWSTIFKD